MARDLQTKIGHAELAKNELINALQHERELIRGLRAEIETLELRVQEAEARAEAAEKAANEHHANLADERHARKTLEKALRAAEAARDSANQLVLNLSDQTRATPRNDPPPRRRPVEEPVVAAVRRGRPPLAVTTEAEPEPVKWWLNPKPAAKRR